MCTFIDSLINFDTEYYHSCYPDLQHATQGMDDVKRKLWLLTHFIRLGYMERRKFRLRYSTQNNFHTDQSPEPTTPDKNLVPDPHQADSEIASGKRGVKKKLHAYRQMCQTDQNGSVDSLGNSFVDLTIPSTLPSTHSPQPVSLVAP
jgi:hypothetical protein